MSAKQVQTSEKIQITMQQLCSSSVQYVHQLKCALAEPTTQLASTKPAYAQFSRTLSDALILLMDTLLSAQATSAINRFDVAIKQLQACLQALNNVVEPVLLERSYGEACSQVFITSKVHTCTSLHRG